MDKKYKINIIKTDAGKCFISDCDVTSGYDFNYHKTKISRLIFDGIPAKETRMKHWFELPEYPKLIQEKITGLYTNQRYELIDKELASEKLPEVITRCNSENYGENIIDSLYTYKSDQVPDTFKDIDCELVVLCEVENFVDAPDFNYPAIKKYQYSDEKYTITNLNIKHSLIDNIILPTPLIANSPCELSSKEMYDITRQYIKDNIDNAQARITSDYDFCFTVMKIIPLMEPETLTYQNIFARTKKERNKIHYVTAKTKEREIFQMTHTQENYKNYTPIKAFRANSELELKESIDTFLKDLIDVINKPICVCEKCNGTGYIE